MLGQCHEQPDSSEILPPRHLAVLKSSSINANTPGSPTSEHTSKDLNTPSLVVDSPFARP